MAPEIKEGKTYDGKKIDMFSTGVILFIIVQGIFPFKEAKKDEYFYNLIIKGDLKTYWSKVGGENLSEDFKDLILKMFSYDPTKRPSVEELKNHPWMQKSCDMKTARSDIIERLHEVRSAKTADTSGDGKSCRGDGMLELVREAQSFIGYKFNDMTDHDIDVNPGVLYEELEAYNNDIKDS